MLSSGFKDAPVSRALLFGLIATSVLASVTDSKYMVWIQVVPHLWPYQQFWRPFTWQVSVIPQAYCVFEAAKNLSPQPAISVLRRHAQTIVVNGTVLTVLLDLLHQLH